MAQKRKSSKAKVNVEVVRVGSNDYVLFRPSNVYPGLRDKQALHIGNLDKYNVFHPTKTYFELTKDYLEAIVFPSDWSLKNIPASNLSITIKEADKTEKTSAASAPKPKKKEEEEELPAELRTIESQISGTFRNHLKFGATWLLYHTAMKLGVVEDLMKVFGDDREKVNRILSLAYYTLMTTSNYDEVEDWQMENFLMTRAYMDYPSVVRIFSGVTEKDCEDFFSLRMERLPKDNLGYECVQTSMYLATEFLIDDFGQLQPKDNTLYSDVVLYGFPLEKGKSLEDSYIEDKVPLYYGDHPFNSLEGDLTAAQQLLQAVANVEPKDYDNLLIVTDHGENDLSELDPIIRKGIKVLTKANTRQDDIKRIIKENSDNLESSSPGESSLFNPYDDKLVFQEITLYRPSLQEDNDMNHEHPKLDDTKLDNTVPDDNDHENSIVSEENNARGSSEQVEVRTTVVFDQSYQEDDMNMINNELEEESEKAQNVIDQKKPIEDRESFENNFFHLKFEYDPDTDTVVDFYHDEEEIAQEVLVAGFEAFRSIGLDADPQRVMYLDGETLEQQYIIPKLKGRSGRNRLVDNEKEALQGKRLVTFIAMILNCYLQNLREENTLFRHGVDVSDFLNEVNQVYTCIKNGKLYFAGKNIAHYQQCLEALGAALPKGVRLPSNTK